MLCGFLKFGILLYTLRFVSVCLGVLRFGINAYKYCLSSVSAKFLLFFLLFYPLSFAQSATCLLPYCKSNAEKFVFPPLSMDCIINGYESVSNFQCPPYTLIEECAEDSSYIKCDSKSWCLENGYDLTGCDVPEYLDEQCPNGERLYMYCTENVGRACHELNETYVKECEEGYIRDDTALCPYSAEYAKCCNACEGFDYLLEEIGEGYIAGESCESCGDVVKYKRIMNLCEGYYSCSNGGAIGASKCKHGEETWYSSCGYNACDLDICPSGTDCTYEACSGKYCAVGCLVGYNYFCDKNFCRSERCEGAGCAPSCPSGYGYFCSFNFCG